MFYILYFAKCPVICKYLGSAVMLAVASMTLIHLKFNLYIKHKTETQCLLRCQPSKILKILGRESNPIFTAPKHSEPV